MILRHLDRPSLTMSRVAGKLSSLGVLFGTPRPASGESAALQSDLRWVLTKVDRIGGLVLTKSSDGKSSRPRTRHFRDRSRSRSASAFSSAFSSYGEMRNAIWC